MAIPITVTSNNIRAFAYDDATGTVNDVFNSTAIPATQTLTATSGNSSSVTDINYTGDATSAVLSVDMSHSIDNTGGASTPGGFDYAYTDDVYFYFTADLNTTYEISGFYDMLGTATRTYTEVWLRDLTAGTTLMREHESSDFTASESFLVDGLGTGDISNYILGSLTGDLLAGHNYQFYFANYIQSYNGAETFTANTATGNMTLTIGTPTSVPEPSILALLSLGLIGMGVVRKRSIH